MKNYFANTRYLVWTGILSAVIYVTGTFLNLRYEGKIIFQFSDGIFFAWSAIIYGPMMLVAAFVGYSIVNLAVGALVYIPITFTIHCLMFLTIKLFTYKNQNKWLAMISFIISAFYIYLYVIYTYILYGYSFAITEIVSDTGQVGSTIIISISLYFFLHKINNQVGSIIFQPLYYN